MVKGLILSGGKSTRMGTEKFLLQYHGMPQYQHLYLLFEFLSITPYISCNPLQLSQVPDSYRIIVDRHEAIGPMGGIASAFRQDPDAAWIVIACDLPFIDADAVKRLVDERSQAVDVVTYQKKNTSFCETTVTLYEPSSFERIKKSIGDKKYSLQHVLAGLRVNAIFPEDERLLFNVNTQEDMDMFCQKKTLG